MSISVGKSSSRTPFKHWILNAELGRLCGIFANKTARLKVHAKASPFHVIDMCAGDGEATEDGESSPAIICRHLKFARRHGVDVKATMIERQDNTFEALQVNVSRDRYSEWVELIHGDSRDYDFPCCSRHQAVFVHIDPNSIADWPVTEQFLDSLSETTTMLATLGCNVGGLKRLEPDKRVAWYGYVKGLLRNMPQYHDAILVRLDRDAAQWAYLLRLPAKWTSATIDSIRKAGDRYSPFDLDISSMRHDLFRFEAMQHLLFKTEAERTEL